nr:unnamed protein product [Callosobruchus chinensis]
MALKSLLQERNRGVDESIKNVIISTLKPIISETRLRFWKDLSVICEAYEDDSDDFIKSFNMLIYFLSFFFFLSNYILDSSAILLHSLVDDFMPFQIVIFIISVT